MRCESLAIFFTRERRGGNVKKTMHVKAFAGCLSVSVSQNQYASLFRADFLEIVFSCTNSARKHYTINDDNDSITQTRL